MKINLHAILFQKLNDFSIDLLPLPDNGQILYITIQKQSTYHGSTCTNLPSTNSIVNKSTDSSLFVHNSSTFTALLVVESIEVRVHI